ncbi:MAG TPA: efflux RND transporter permease subunit [Polyangiaceae bacterium]
MIGLIRNAATRPIGVSIIYVAVVVFGAVALRYLAVDLYPEIDVPRISITTPYEGVAPEEIETLITRPIEQATSTIEGVDRIEAVSAEGLSRVQLQFRWGTELQQALDDVRVAIDRVRARLPEEAEPPTVFKFDLASIPVAFLGAAGGGDQRRLKYLAEEDLSRALERVPGVASVDVNGGYDREIRVSLDVERLSAYGVTAERVAAALARENRTVSAGDMRDAGRQVVIRTAGEFTSLEQIQSVVVATHDQRPIHVRDLGAVLDTIRRVRSELWIDGSPGIRLRVYKQSGANTVEVARELRREIENINREYRGRAQLSMLWDGSDFIRAAVSNVQSSAMMGAVLAALVLFFFLRSARATLAIATAIPTSVMATFGLMHFTGMTLNVISFGGLALGIGMLVDAAIVILENIHHERASGRGALEAAVEGARQVGPAVIAGTLTTMAVFVPVVFMGDFAGIFFREMALVVTFALGCSLAVSLTLIPMLSARLLKTEPGAARSTGVARRAERLLERLDGAYERLLRGALRAPWAVVFGAVVLLGASIAFATRIGTELMPQADEGRIDVDMELPVGTPLETTSSVIQKVEHRVRDSLRPGELDHIVTSAGPEAWWRPTGSNEGEVDVTLAPVAGRDRSVDEAVVAIQDAVSDIPGAKFQIRPVSSDILTRILRRGNDRISVEVRGHDLGAADELAERVVAIVGNTPGVTFARPDRELGQLERVIEVNRTRAAELGLGSAEIAETVEHYVAGRVSTHFRERGDEFDIRVQLEESERERLDQLGALPIVTASGEQVPLSSLVTVRERRGPSSISRVDQERTLRINAGTGSRPLGEIAADLEQRLAGLSVPAGFSIAVTGEVAEQQDTFLSMLLGILLAAFLVFAVMAVQFESLRHPLVIMASVPFALVGVVGALVVTDTTLNMNSALGAIVLVGIVVNNAIVLVDYTNLLRRERGASLLTAVVEAGRRRLRPILMTTLTTALALLPLALGVGEGSEIQAPLARVVVGGLLTSTAVTLLLVPSLYLVAERREQKVVGDARALVGAPEGAAAE